MKAASQKDESSYYAFGMEMPGRSVGSDYQYGMNGQMKDNEVFEGFMSAEFWGYDSRLGRRWEVDPLSYPWQSPYATFDNNPIYFSDALGLEGEPEKGQVNKCEDGTYEMYDGKNYVPYKGKEPLKKNADGRYVPPAPILNKQSLAAKGIDASKYTFSYVDRSGSFAEASNEYLYKVSYDNLYIGSVIVKSTLNQPALVKWYYDSEFRATVNKDQLVITIKAEESYFSANEMVVAAVQNSSYTDTPSDVYMGAIAGTELIHNISEIAVNAYSNKYGKSGNKVVNVPNPASFEEVVSNPSAIWEKSAAEIQHILGPDFKLAKYNGASTAIKWSDSKGNTVTINYGGGLHSEGGPTANKVYIKITGGGKVGKIKVVDRNTYKPTESETDTKIIYAGE